MLFATAKIHRILNLFKECGNDIWVCFSCSYTESTICVGSLVTIGNGCWVDANTIILKGTGFGKVSVIEADAIVTKGITPYSIFASSSGNNFLKPSFDKKSYSSI